MFHSKSFEFDFKDSKLTFAEEIALRDLALGVYETDNDDDLMDTITAETGYEVVNIYYEVQSK